MNKYRVTVEWSERDQMWVGLSPDFVGLAVVAPTRAKAFKEAEAAVAAFIEILVEDGIPLPEPRTVIEQSGQLRLRISKSLHARAVERAEADGVSLNQYISNALNREVSGGEVAERCLKAIRDQVLQVHIAVWQKANNAEIIIPGFEPNRMSTTRTNLR